jgi:hypothetical protein
MMDGATSVVLRARTMFPNVFRELNTNDNNKRGMRDENEKAKHTSTRTDNKALGGMDGSRKTYDAKRSQYRNVAGL